MEFVRLEENYVRKAYSELNLANKYRGKLSFVTSFLKNLPQNSLILDIGCGEHIHLRQDCFTIGIDICLPVERKEKSTNSNFLLSNLMYLPFR
nr:unnamed protein product [Meloidogyne enterolobii]